MGSKAKTDNQNIQVFVRVRPFNATEKSRAVVNVKSAREISVQDNKQHSTLKTFKFNHVFGQSSAQIDVYKSVVQPLINEVISGYNCTVFAYGQTGTGKTFTMEGNRSSDPNISWENDPLAGIVPRTLSQLFDELRLLEVDFCVKVSFLELYNEELFDLLSAPGDTTKLKIYDDASKKGAVIVSGLEEVAVNSKSDVYRILERGSHKRQTAATLMNAHSSRSHTVFTVTVHMRLPGNEGEEVMRTGKMNLVDLAGSENIGRSGAVEKRAREAGNINQSLLTLGRVISALVDHSPHVPYRESKLTRILQESLGGRTKTSIIATVSPSASDLEETLSTLEYAHRAKNIQNKPEVNQKFCKRTVLKEFSVEIERLQRDLEATQQRSGIYLDQAEYDNMLLMLDQLEGDIKSKDQEMTMLEEELNKKLAVCDELSAEVKKVEEVVEERKAVHDEQKSMLSKLKTEKAEVITDTSEKEYLMMCHMETFQHLTPQADALQQTTLSTISNAELLHDKVDRTRLAAQQNQSSIGDFVLKSNSIINSAKDLIHTSVNGLSEKLYDLESAVGTTITDLGTGLSNGIAAATGFSSSQQQSTHLRRTLNNAVNQNSESLSSLKSLKENFSATLASNQETYSSLVDDELEATGILLDDYRKFLEDLLGLTDSDCLDAGSAVEEWTSAIPAKFRDDVLGISSEAEKSAKNLHDLTKRDDMFLQQYNELQEQCEEKFCTVAKMVAEIRAIQDKCSRLVELHELYEEQTLTSVLSANSEAMSLAHSAFENEKSMITMVQSQLQDKLHLASKHVTDLTAQTDFNCSLLPIETLSHSAEAMTDRSALFQRDVDKCLKQDILCCSELASDVNAQMKDIDSSILTASGHVLNHVSYHTSLVEKLKREAHNKVDAIGVSIKSLHLSLTEKVEELDDALEHVEQFGAKPSTPTGKTPVRTDVCIPRNLPATSPHERILSRLRNKYRTKMSAELSTDSAFSDGDLDHSISDQDILAEKENSVVEKDGSEKHVQSKVPVLRKPLSQNN